MILPKIKDFFIHSKFYKNYNIIPKDVIKEYNNIKNYYKESKFKLKNEIKDKLVNFIHYFSIYNVDDQYLENYILWLIEKYEFKEIYEKISNLNEDLLNKIYNLNTIKLLIETILDEDCFIYKNDSQEYRDKNQLKSITKMNLILKKIEIKNNLLKEKLKFNNDIENYLIRFEDLDTACFYASKNDNIKYIKFLLNNGVNIHTGNDFLVKYFSINENIKMVKFLIKKKGLIFMIMMIMYS